MLTTPSHEIERMEEARKGRAAGSRGPDDRCGCRRSGCRRRRLCGRADRGRGRQERRAVGETGHRRRRYHPVRRRHGRAEQLVPEAGRHRGQRGEDGRGHDRRRRSCGRPRPGQRHLRRRVRRHGVAHLQRRRGMAALRALLRRPLGHPLAHPRRQRGKRHHLQAGQARRGSQEPQGVPQHEGRRAGSGRLGRGRGTEGHEHGHGRNATTSRRRPSSSRPAASAPTSRCA